MSDARTRVFLIDDHEMARRGLAAMLSAADWIDVVGDAASCRDGVEAARTLKPDVVLLDLRMPGMDGLMCLEELKQLDPPMAVVIVTLYDDRRYVLEALRRGAAGYILKDASTTEVIAMVATVAAGNLAVDGALLREALATPGAADSLPGSARDRADDLSVTTRELDVLRLVADGLTNKEIAGRLEIADDTVKKHVQNILWKLRVADRTQAAIVAYRAGLLEDAPASG